MADTIYDFRGLTPAQHRLLAVQGWVPGFGVIPRPMRRTYQPLVDRGLAVFHPKRVGGTDLGWIEVPLDVHMAYCLSADEA